MKIESKRLVLRTWEETDINDLLWHEWSWICEMLDIDEE